MQVKTTSAPEAHRQLTDPLALLPIDIYNLFTHSKNTPTTIGQEEKYRLAVCLLWGIF